MTDTYGGCSAAIPFPYNGILLIQANLPRAFERYSRPFGYSESSLTGLVVSFLTLQLDPKLNSVLGFF